MNMPQLAGEETPEFYRRRYFELKAQADRANARRPAPSASDNPKVVPDDLIVVEETIPGFWYWTQKIARGHTLRVVGPYSMSTGVVAVGVDPKGGTLRGGADVRRERYIFGW